MNTYAYVGGNPLSYIDFFGLELQSVNLNGLGDTYLDSAFIPKVNKFVEGAKASGVTLHFNSAFRDPKKQSSLKKDPNAITPADNSLHSCGFAVDINYSSLKDILGGLTGGQQREKIRAAAKEAGLKWGGNFTKKDPPHFYHDPGNRNDKINEAVKKWKELTGNK